jgi:hypothetical protein
MAIGNPQPTEQYSASGRARQRLLKRSNIDYIALSAKQKREILATEISKT